MITKLSGLKTNTLEVGDTEFATGGSFNIPSAGSYSFKEDGTVKLAIDEGILKVDTVNELTATAGVTIDGVLCKDIGVKCDKIEEKTALNDIEIANYTKLTANPLAIVTILADATTVTGDGTVYVIAFDTEVVDIGADYNTTTFKFTAPVNGYYRFNLIVQLDEVDNAASEVAIDLYDGTTTHVLWNGLTGGILQASKEITVNGEKTLKLAAASYIQARVTATGEGADSLTLKKDYSQLTAQLISTY